MKLQMILPMLAALVCFQSHAQPANAGDKASFPIEALLPKSKLTLSSSIFRNARVPETFKGEASPRLVVGYTGDELLVSYNTAMSFTAPGGGYSMVWDFRAERPTENYSSDLLELNQGYMDLTNLIKKVNKYAKWGSHPHAYLSYGSLFASYNSKVASYVTDVVQKANQNAKDASDPSGSIQKAYASALKIILKTWNGYLQRPYVVAHPERCAIYFAPGQDQNLPGVIDESGLDRTLVVKSIEKDKSGFVTIQLSDPNQTVTRLECQDISTVGQLYKLMDSNIEDSNVDVKKYFRAY